MIFLMRFPHIPLFLLLGATRASAESFESVPAGPFNRLETAVGRWSADDGNAWIHAGRGKSGKQSQRIGYAVRLPGDDKSKAYRIPGLARTNAGTMVAVYDIRFRHAGDLPADVDVGVSRSTDGGQSWEPMIVAMDMGNDPKHGYEGVGDPALHGQPAALEASHSR